MKRQENESKEMGKDRMKEGFAVVASLLFVGVILQLTIGAIDWDVFAWPVNALVLCALIGISVVAWLWRKRCAAIRFLGTLQAAIPAMVVAAVLTIVMGLTRQNQGAPLSDDAIGITYMLGQWMFVLTYLYIVVILVQTLLNEMAKAVSTRGKTLATLMAPMLSHGGLIVALTCGTLGNADMQRLRMICFEGEPEWRGLTQKQEVVELPMSITLKRFILEEYADGSPRRYASEIRIFTTSGERLDTTIDVNRPAEVEGWKIYQYGYDMRTTPDDSAARTHATFSILELVADPWMPWVYAGIFMMMAGAAGMMIKRKR